MRFINAVFWEMLQNIPVIVPFVIAVWFWAQGRKKAALLCMLGGAIVGSLVIRWTEPLTTGYEEPLAVTISNIVVLSLLQVPAAIYLAVDRRWSNWRTDLALGGIAGVGVALSQALAAVSLPWIGILLHSLSLAISGAFVMLGTRASREKPFKQAMANAWLMSAVMTLIISTVDYGYFLIFR